MKLALSDSQTLLKDTVARLFKDESTPARIRAAEETGFDKALWDQLVALGVVGMRAVSPDDGGSSLLDTAIIAEEAGRSEEHTSELQSLMRISYAVFCLKKK